jgi:hypothetical protein
MIPKAYPQFPFPQAPEHRPGGGENFVENHVPIFHFRQEYTTLDLANFHYSQP